MNEEEIKNVIKSKDIIIGYRKAIKFMKSDKPKMVIIANNIPEKMKKEIETHVKIFNLDMRVFDGDSKKLGIICGKPYPVTTIIVKE
jgi:large subunit ribosomal protein L30e